MDRRQALKTVGGVVASSVFAPTTLRAQPRTLRFGHVLNENHPYHLALLRFAEDVERLTDGSLRISVYSSGQLGQETEIIEGSELGIIDGGLAGASSLALISGVKKYYLFDLPFLFNSYEAVEKFVETPVARELMSADPATGVRILGLGTAGFHQLLNNKRSIYTPEDLSGFKFRVWQSPSAVLAFEVMGMTPTPMAFGEVFTAMQQGVVDGVTNSLTTFYLSKFYEVGKYVTIANPIYVGVFLMISEMAFSSLSAKEQEAIQMAGNDACKFWRAQYLIDADYGPKLTEMGCIVNEANRDAFVSHVRPQYQRFVDLIGDESAKGLADRVIEAAET